jgi:hypothetical protein
MRKITRIIELEMQRYKMATKLKTHLFCLRAILFVVGTAAELAGYRGKITIVNRRGKAGHDLVVDAEKVVTYRTKETTHRFLKAPSSPALGSCSGGLTSSGITKEPGEKIL